MYDENPHIPDEMMLTGGSPNYAPCTCKRINPFSQMKEIFLLLSKLKGSHFLPTDYPINLLSISPKFSNSIPVVGVETPQGAITMKKMVKHITNLE